jgi:hypothetical protein
MNKSNFFSYLMAKRSEIRDMRVKDILLAKAIVDIHRHTIRRSLQNLKLSEIVPMHAIDRENALESLSKRTQLLKQHRVDILRRRSLSKADLLDYLPSVSGIKVVALENYYVSFEGNGRLEAFKRAFLPEDKLSLEVEVFEVDEIAKIQRRVNRVRRRNRLLHR